MRILPGLGSILICEFFGARIVLNPPRMAGHTGHETNLAHPVLNRPCELRQLALRKSGAGHGQKHSRAPEISRFIFQPHCVCNWPAEE